MGRRGEEIHPSIHKYIYYARAVNNTLLIILRTIAAQQVNPTTKTMAQVKQFLNYSAIHEELVITYRKIDMV